MATHVIYIDPLNPFSIGRAEARIREVLREFEGKVSQFLTELAEIGQRAAQGAYGNAITVTVEEIKNGVCIRANGDAVVFLEFGAGSATDSSDMFADAMPFEVRPGSYSEVHYDQNTNSPRPSYHIDGYWEFGGVEYTQVQPRNGMQKAFDAMMQDMRLLAMRVFG